jgi:AraC-like DNA-binding protein
MIYREFQPDQQLADFVKSYWWFDNTASQSLDFTILPDGCFDLLVHFQGNQLVEVALTGIWTKQVDITIDADMQIFGIRFKLLAVDYIFQQKIAAFCNDEQSLLTDFWEINKTDFTDLPSAIADFNKIMVSILGRQKSINPKKQKLSNLLYQTRGELTVGQYSEQVFWTSRQMNRYFNERFGISLKAFCNILKCFASYQHIKSGELHPQHNYFDQSHFIKSLKKHTGNSPSTLFENKNDRFLQLTDITKN